MRTDEGKYLIEEHAFTYLDDIWQLPSAGTKFSGRDVATLLLGGIDFTGRRLPGSAKGAPELAALPGTRLEVDSIAELHKAQFKKKGSLTVLKESEATEEGLRRALAKSAIVHLATHGYLMPERLLLYETGLGSDQSLVALRLASRPEAASGLVLGLSAKSIAESDGLLDAAEVARLDGKSWKLVVLSACHAARGLRVNGEGLGSLRRAFHLAGAERVISPCWAVDDTDTQRMMEIFYEQLWKRKRAPHEALRNAQLALLKEKRKQGVPDGAPGSWGAWLVSGGWR